MFMARLALQGNSSWILSITHSLFSEPHSLSLPKKDSGTQNSSVLISRLLWALSLIDRAWIFIQRIKGLHNPEKSGAQCSGDKCPLNQHAPPQAATAPLA